MQTTATWGIISLRPGQYPVVPVQTSDLLPRHGIVMRDACQSNSGERQWRRRDIYSAGPCRLVRTGEAGESRVEVGCS